MPSPNATDWTDRQLAMLRPKYPQWDLWVVHVYQPKHTVWCARPTGTPTATINADSPEALITEIAEQEAAAL